jgi:hypothetical protein
MVSSDQKESAVTRRILTVVLAGGLAAFVAAQDAKTGTQPGQVLPGPFRALVVVNPDAPKQPEGVLSEDRANLGDLARVGKFHDLVTRYGVDPAVGVFSRELPQGGDTPLAKLVKALDEAVGKSRNARLHAYAIFLTMKNDFTQDVNQPVQIKKIQDFAEQVQDKNVPMGLDRAESERTKAYDLPADASVVVLTYVNLTVKTRHAFTADRPLDDAAVQAILGDVNSLIGRKK